MKILLLSLGLLFGSATISSSLLASGRVNCEVQARSAAEMIRTLNWGGHKMSSLPTSFRTESTVRGNREVLLYSLEWVDTTVGGDAMIDVYVNPVDCVVQSIDADLL